MKFGHLSDEDIQNYALDLSNLSMEALEHLKGCVECQNEAEIYRVLFTEIEKPPFVSLGEDFSEMMVKKLSENEQAMGKRTSMIYYGTGLAIGLGFVFALLYFLILLLLGNQTGLVVSLLLLSAAGITMLLAHDLSARHKRQLVAMDASGL